MNRFRKSLASIVLGATALVGSGRSALAQEDYREALSMPSRVVSVLEQRDMAARAAAAALPSPVIMAPLAAEQDALATTSYVYYVPASAHAGGAFGSFWVSDLLGRHPGSMTGPAATISVIAHPRGQVMSASDPAIPSFTVPGGASFDFLDVLDRVRYSDNSGFSGAAWLEIRSTMPLSIEAVPTYNLPPTGERTGNTIAPLDARTLLTNPRLAHEGDSIEVRLMGGRQNFRENEITFVPPESGDVTMVYEHLDLLGNRKALTTMDVPAGSYQQQTVEALTGQPVLPGDTIRKTVTRKNGTDPSKELLAYSIISQIHTLNPQFQDSAALEGTRYPLVENASYTTLPAVSEVNDPISTSVLARVRDGAIIESVAYDIDGDGNQDGGAHPGNGTNTYTEVGSGVSLVPFSTTKPNVRLNITENGRNYYRWIQGTPWSVTAEKNGYVATYDNAKAFIMNNLDTASLWSSRTLLDGKLYSPAEWKVWWQELFDGLSSNDELDKMEFNDTGNQIVLHYKFRTGKTYMNGAPEREFDDFKTRTKASLP